MKRKLTLLLLALVACISLSVGASADGPVCGTTSNPSLVCPASAPSPSLEDLAMAVAENMLALIP